MTGSKNANKEGAAGPRLLRAVGYLRVSTNAQAEEGMGVQAQRRAVREYATGEGLDLVDFVSEAGSGAPREGELFSLEHRPVMCELIGRAERAEYDVLVVATLDRLSRDQTGKSSRPI